MSEKISGTVSNWRTRGLRAGLPLPLLLLIIEWFDELHFGIMGAALPSMRADLNLSYEQIGVLLGLPVVLSAFTEPALMLLGDTRLRKSLIVGGGLVVAASAVMLARATFFAPALAAFILVYPASGAFVTLAQATLMDLNPGREPQMMARWTVFGALGNLMGPLMLTAMYAIGQDWRGAYLAMAWLALGLALLVLPHRFRSASHTPQTGEAGSVSRVPPGDLLRGTWEALRSPALLRWFILLNMSDLLLDVFIGYAALYFADHVGMTPAQVGLMLSAMMAVDLIAHLLLIRLLERFEGRLVVRYSALIAGTAYAAWLLAPWMWAKIVLALVVEFTTLGWYEVLQGEAYATLPGRSGTVMAINSVMGLLGGALVWFVGWTAQVAGLPAAMWLLLAGPLALALFTPKPVRGSKIA